MSGATSIWIKVSPMCSTGCRFHPVFFFKEVCCRFGFFIHRSFALHSHLCTRYSCQRGHTTRQRRRSQDQRYNVLAQFERLRFFAEYPFSRKSPQQRSKNPVHSRLASAELACWTEKSSES